MIYTSRPHKIKAFQFNGASNNMPDWFWKAYYIGVVQICLKKGEEHLTIYGDNQTEKVFLNGWVCESEYGKIYGLTNEKFILSYAN